MLPFTICTIPYFHFAEYQRFFRWTLSFALLLTICLGPRVANAEDEPSTERLILMCSTTQIADFARQVVGDRMDVQCILTPGQDPHMYEVTPSDAQRVASADLCLQNGMHLEGKNWMQTLADDENKPVVTCTTGVQPIILEEEGKETKIEDPHAWFSPRNALLYTRNVLTAVSELDPDHKSEYEARTALFFDQIRALDAWIKRQVNAIPVERRVLVTSHDAFNYFCRDFNFQSQSPAGWSTGPEIGGGPTPAKRKETVESIRTTGVKAIFVETSTNPKLIRIIAQEAGVVVGGTLYSDSMGDAGSAGETYIGMMRENVLTIVTSLTRQP